MDQISISYGGCISIDFKNPNNLNIRKYDFDFKRYGYRLVLVHTQGNHGDLSDEYGYIPSEMKMVASMQGKNVLSECEKDSFISNISIFRKEGNDRALLRAYHFFKENERVNCMIQAIERREIRNVLNSMKESGLSSNMYLQNIYPVTNVKHQSLNLALAISEDFLKDDGIVRVHGGGFEGCIQAIVKDEKVEAYCQLMQRIFTQESTFLFDVRTKGACRII